MDQSQNQRNIDLDIVKGMLVLVMLVYHCASATTDPSFLASAGKITNRLSFIHYAFLLISGYLCGWYYTLDLYKSFDNIRRRLLTRGVKLIGIFFFLNLICYGLRIGYSPEKLITKIGSTRDLIALLNGPPGYLAAFEVLYYISLFLLLASIIAGRKVFFLMVVVILTFLAGSNKGVPYWLLLGVIGMVIGKWARNGYFVKLWVNLEKMKGFPIIGGLFVYQIFIMQVHEFGQRFSLNYLSIIIYLVESLLWFLSFIFILRFFKENNVIDIITLIGKYTLLGYMAQMVLVRLGYFILGSSRIAGPESYFINLTLGGICLYICILAIDHFRIRTNLIRQSYRLIFQ